jgi:putative hydrolase of the HAD superfamily
VSFYEDFKNCFDAFYLSYKINLVKPNLDIFKFVLNENNLKAGECLFVDDNQDNINGAQSLGIKTWYIDPKTQDVINLYDTKSDLF